MNVIEIPVDQITRDPEQPRKIFDSEKLDNLAKSVAEVGLLHPILVRQTDNGYQLVAGERRFQAVKSANKKTISAVVLSPGLPVKQVQLVENLQREDLNPLERAMAIREYMQVEGLNKVQAADKLAVPRTTLTDWMDILDVEERYRRAVVDNFEGGDSPVTMSHVAEALALASRLKSPAMCNVVLDAVIEYRLSKVETREVCALVRNNADTTVEEAVRVVRRPAEVNKLPKEQEDERKAVERNIEQWVAILERSSNTLAELCRVAPTHLPEKDKERIIERLLEIRGLVGETLDHMTVEGELLDTAI
ncbi:MAG: ParB/RepB/Spo0J family partition protein [Limnochordia bacterium]|jgi:ParB family chromosome partitioning protein